MGNNDDNTMVSVGTVLHGFCNGFFGRDAYENKKIEALGADWVVARGMETGAPMFCDFSVGWQTSEMHELLQKWANTYVDP